MCQEIECITNQSI